MHDLNDQVRLTNNRISACALKMYPFLKFRDKAENNLNERSVYMVSFFAKFKSFKISSFVVC